MHKGGKDSCQGDSGGPLIVSDSNNKAVIYGIGLFHVNIPSSQIILNLKNKNVVRNKGLILSDVLKKP